MPGTIDNAVNRKSDEKPGENLDKEAKQEQQEAEDRRKQERRDGPVDQAPGEVVPEQHG